VVEFVGSGAELFGIFTPFSALAIGAGGAPATQRTDTFDVQL
jgi:hypothetical protein